MTHSFEGKVALVTGASAGMGFATSRAFASAGASVALADVDPKSLERTVDELKSDGHRVIGIP